MWSFNSPEEILKLDATLKSLRIANHISENANMFLISINGKVQNENMLQLNKTPPPYFKR